MRVVRIDGRLMGDREIFHETIAAELNFPGWYGKNLDALYDCLTDLGEDTRLQILYPEALEEQMGYYGEKIIATLLEAQEENEYLTVRLGNSEKEPGDRDAEVE